MLNRNVKEEDARRSTSVGVDNDYSNRNGRQSLESKKGEELLKCIKESVYLESDVGEKENKKRSMELEISKYSESRRQVEGEINELCEKIKVVDVRDEEFSLSRFREVCFLKHALYKKVNEKTELGKKSALLIKESKIVEKQIEEETKKYRALMVQRETLISRVNQNGNNNE